MTTKQCTCGGTMRHYGGSTWKCNNCTRTTQRTIRRPNLAVSTPSQQRAVAKLQAEWVQVSSRHAHELKHWSVEVLESGKLLVSAIVGMVGDEGTAAVMMRKNRLAKIGRNGRVESM